jgi:hypothetical protein
MLVSGYKLGCVPQMKRLKVASAMFSSEVSSVGMMAKRAQRAGCGGEREIRCEERCFRQFEVVLEGGLGEDLDEHQDHRHRRRQRSSWHDVAPRARWAALDQRGAVCLLLFDHLDLT